jgi:hypothetical protein
MALNNLCFSILVFLSSSLFYHSPAYGNKLVEFITKQETDRIRFITHDGKKTFYQRSSGDLVMSTNYQIKEILKLKEQTQYSMSNSFYRKYFVISALEGYFRNHSLFTTEKIYVLTNDLKNEKSFIADGLVPMLQLQDLWISYYSPQSKTLVFTELNTPKTIFNIKTKNKNNHYFIPQTLMASEKQIIFTDFNDQFKQELNLYDRQKNQTTTLLSTSSVHQRFEICDFPTEIIIGLFSTGTALDNQNESTIWKIEKKSIEQPEKMIKIYHSTLSDKGLMTCHHDAGKIFFLKRFENEKTIRDDLVTLNLEDNQFKEISNLGNVSKFLSLDGTILVPQAGKYYLFHGDNAAIVDNFSEKTEPLTPTEP